MESVQDFGIGYKGECRQIRGRGEYSSAYASCGGPSVRKPWRERQEA